MQCTRGAMKQAAAFRRSTRTLCAAAAGAGIALLLLLQSRALVMHLRIVLADDRSSREVGLNSSSACGGVAPTAHRHALLHDIVGNASTAAGMPQAWTATPQDSDVAASRRRFASYLASPQFAAASAQLLQQPPSTAGTNRGILVVAGGRKLLAHLVVQLKVLREVLGCRLPVQVAYQGLAEMDNATLAALQQHYGPLSAFDVQAAPGYPPNLRRVALTRWVGKVAALLFCSFDEVLLLDSDNLPLVDPSWVFQDALYLRHSNLFWPDYWSNWVKPGVFPWLGLNRSVVQSVLMAGGSHTGRDTESGMLAIDRRRWLAVLHWVLWVNSWHDRLYFRLIHGDKDTFALAFALAGQAHAYRQVSVVPGGVFRWGPNALEIKCDGPAGSCPTTDGWQLLGPLQHDDTGRAVFFHRTMNKMSPDEDPWPAEVVTGPLPDSFLHYYLAHDSLGPTKGVWWEHVCPAEAFTLLQGTPERQPEASSSSSCPASLFLLYAQAAAAGLPVSDELGLVCRCRGTDNSSVSSVSSSSSSSSSSSRSVPAARVTPAFVQLSPALRVIAASVDALWWLKSAAGHAAFPSLAPGQ